MAKKKQQKSKAKSGKKPPPPKNVAENRKAKHQYEIFETLECGMVLVGSEVKSMRDGKLSLDEAYGRIQGGELWLIGADIGHYSNAGLWNHDPRRPRKLLVHSRELDKVSGKAKERGVTIVPLRVFFNERGIAKCVIGLVRGKKLHDKRETLKKRDTDRGLARAMRRR
ncbi:SsrA-binding protein [Rosistilla ulvae]|uniref:SsrA-binding protein n=1 Tax=Rosistilla ulvae TaxID=1930277 RepID=A0A517LWT6_9BACT|nr:SsrA-binding protein SmpB [Rosistilla ulvae]QDS87096.1 SsrA-binding protein [Rosistilla ulvae]